MFATKRRDAAARGRHGAAFQAECPTEGPDNSDFRLEPCLR